MSMQGVGGSINLLGTLAHLFSIALMLQIILKLFYNIFSKSKIHFDKWSFIDLISAALNIVAVVIVSNI